MLAVTSGAPVIVKSPLAHVTPNVIINARLLEAAHFAGVGKFLFISTGTAYPDLGDIALKETDILRGDPPPIYFSSGWMKRYGEILCRTYAYVAKPPIAASVVRVSNVYGPRDKFDLERAHVTAAQIRRVIDRHRQFWSGARVTKNGTCFTSMILWRVLCVHSLYQICISKLILLQARPFQ